MRGTISKVWPISEEPKKPGAVVFTDQTRVATFKQELITVAETLVGKEVEYTTTQNGKYTNLASIAAVVASPVMTGPAPTGVSSATAQARDGRPSLDEKLFERAVVALESIVAELRRVLACTADTAMVPSGAATEGGKAAYNTADAQAKLAAVAGEDAAGAMGEALRKKHKKPEALAAAWGELLRAHGIEG